MLGGCILEFISVKVDEKDTVGKRLRQEISSRNASDTTGSASDDNVFAPRVDHVGLQRLSL